MDKSMAFELYRMYSHAAREDAARMKDTLCESEFGIVWQSLSNNQRSRWESRFRSGLRHVIASESRQYASILSSDNLRTLKAA